MRQAAVFLAVLIVVPSCSRRPTGPTPLEMYEEYENQFAKARALEKNGNRVRAIQTYIEAKEALENLKATYPKSAYFDQADLARAKDVITRLKDEERRGVEETIAGQEGPPRPPEPKLSGDVYWSMRRAMEAKLGKQNNQELDRIKRIEPDVVDNLQALVVHILANDRMITGMMLQEVNRDMKEALKVLHVHEEELALYQIIVVSGYKAVAGAGGYAEPVLMVEYKFSPEDFKGIDWSKMDDEEADISEFATSTREP